jgi:hypothetical protein
MTNTPGDGDQPPDPYGQSGQPQDPYGQPSTAPQYAQPQYGQSPYGVPQPFPPGAYAPDHPKATTSLVLGILGIVICGIIAPFAWQMGKRTVAEIDASNGQLGTCWA